MFRILPIENVYSVILFSDLLVLLYYVRIILSEEFIVNKTTYFLLPDYMAKWSDDGDNNTISNVLPPNN